jgi:hypothetical protein
MGRSFSGIVYRGFGLFWKCSAAVPGFFRNLHEPYRTFSENTINLPDFLHLFPFARMCPDCGQVQPSESRRTHRNHPVMMTYKGSCSDHESISISREILSPEESVAIFFRDNPPEPRASPMRGWRSSFTLLIRDPPPFFADTKEGGRGVPLIREFRKGLPLMITLRGSPLSSHQGGTPDPLSPDTSVEIQVLKLEYAKGVLLMIGSRGSGSFFCRPQKGPEGGDQFF